MENEVKDSIRPAWLTEDLQTAESWTRKIRQFSPIGGTWNMNSDLKKY